MHTEIDSSILVQAVNAANDGFVITDNKLPDNPIVFVNEAFEKMTGYKREEILHRNCRFLQGEDRHQEALGILRQAIREGKPCRVEMRNYKKDGTLFWNELSMAPLIGKNGEITHFVGIQKNITNQKRLEEALYSQTRQDPLTLLYNRRGFLVEARRAVLLARRQSINLRLVMIDIDNFKKINDSYGHTVGDNVLMIFGTFLKKNLRETDIVVRYGGDEFMLILFENEHDVYEKWLARLEESLNSFNASRLLPFLLSISIGSARIHYSEFKSLIAAINEADAAMCVEKKKKKLQQVPDRHLMTSLRIS